MKGRQSVAGFLCRALTKAFNKNVNYINNKAVGAGERPIKVCKRQTLARRPAKEGHRSIPALGGDTSINTRLQLATD